MDPTVIQVTVVQVTVGAAAGALVAVPVRTAVTRLAGRDPHRGGCEAACVAGGGLAGLLPAWPHAVVFALLAWWCVCAATVDVLVRRLPNVLTVGGGAVIVGAALAAGHGRAALVGAALLTVPLLVVHLAAPGALGGGDVKLAVGLGAITGVAGASAWMIGALLPPVLTGVAGLIAMRRRGRGAAAGAGPAVLPHGPAVLPHGPSMCAAALLALLLTG